MAYVSDGTVYQERPWNVRKIMAIFWGIINLFVAFFQTLIPGFLDNGTSTSNGFRSGGNRGRGGNGGFGGGSGYGGGRRPPRPPSHGRGNIHGLNSLPPPNPPPACGSCCGL